MARCGIVTLFDDNYNYGGQLQAFAMVKLFEAYNYEAEIISFSQNNKKYVLQRFRQLGIKEFTKRIFNKIRFRLSASKAKDSGYTKRIDRFKVFMNQIPHTRRFEAGEICKADQLFDFYVCGSDQVWNPGWWNDTYFLGFTHKPRFSYAASIGKDTLTNEELEYISQKTKDYIGVSVREASAKEILLPYLCTPVYTVLDPTMMIDENIWKKMMVLPSENDYVLIYKIGEVAETAKNIYKYCRSHNLKVISIGHAKNTYDKGDNLICDVLIDSAGPSEWLGLIYKAKYIFTDSFHGTVFSILFKKDFWCFEKTSNSVKSENTRLYSLLDRFGLRNRVISGISSIENQLNMEEIYYDEVIERLSQSRLESREFIDNCLSKI